VTVKDTIRRYLASTPNYQGAEDELTDQRELIGEEILDSVGIYQLVSYLEDEFGVEVDDDELVFENFATLADITTLVEGKLA
jgi:acyl carrier protein